MQPVGSDARVTVLWNAHCRPVPGLVPAGKACLGVNGERGREMHLERLDLGDALALQMQHVIQLGTVRVPVPPAARPPLTAVSSK